MTHERAFALVSEICPRHAGMLWATSQHTGCDTANAVADQYGEDEEREAREALEVLAGGSTPADWELHA